MIGCGWGYLFFCNNKTSTMFWYSAPKALISDLVEPARQDSYNLFFQVAAVTGSHYCRETKPPTIF